MLLNIALLAANVADKTCNQGKTFFGLPVWYKYLKLDPNMHTDPSGACNFAFSFPGDLALIGLAIMEILLRLAGIIAVGYVIWGGIQYMTSQGSPDRTKSAQETIINAIVGLVIAIVATGVVAFIGKSLHQ